MNTSSNGKSRFEALARKNAKALVISASSLVSFILTAFILRHGVAAFPLDSWIYWEGSVNLIEHRSYSTFRGSPITEWPPLFSVYLALFQCVLSQTGWTLCLAMSSTSALVSGAWSAYVFSVFKTPAGWPTSVAFTGSLVFVALFASLCCTGLLANSLLLVFVGLLFNHLASIADQPGQRLAFKKPAVAAVILAVACLIHNSSVIFVASTCLIVLLAAGDTLPKRLLAIAGIFFISVVPWLIVRHWLSQGDSHSISRPRYAFGEYVMQLPAELGVFFISSGSWGLQAAVGGVLLVAVLVLLARKPPSDLAKRHRILLGLALLALAGYFILFNLVWINAALGGRFTWFFALAITPVLFSMASGRRAIVAVLLLMTVGVSGWRIAKFAWHGRVPALDVNAREESAHQIYSQYFLTTRTGAMVPRGAIGITLPIFSWEKLPPNITPPLVIVERITLNHPDL